VPATATEVIRYFLRNPEAADTLEGIARWRLMEERVHRSVEDVDRALSWLVAEGFLVEESVEGSRPIFQLNRGKVDEAKEFVTAAGRSHDD
jgi:hypothetical protein